MVGASHASPLQVVEAAVDVVDSAWTAIELHRDHDLPRKDARQLEDEVAQQRAENQRLRIALEDSQKALDDMRQRLDCLADVKPARAVDCPADLYEQLKAKVESPVFLEKLVELQQVGNEENKTPSVMKHGGDMLVNAIHEDPSWWLWVADDLFTSEPSEESNLLGDDSYVIVSQDDVLEGIAMFVARCIHSDPRAKTFTPKELQEAIFRSLAKLESRGKIKRLWDMAKFLYVSASWGTAAIGLYKNPLFLKVVLRAISASCRLIIRVLA